MRARKSFRPEVLEALEDRAVPSADYGWLTGLIGPGPTAATQAVGKAFATFEQAYDHDVFHVLYASGKPSATTRTAFNAQVSTDLQTLEGSISTALGTSNATLNATIDAALTGSASTSLQSELTAIPMTTAHGGNVNVWSFVGRGEYLIGMTAGTVHGQVQSATQAPAALDTETIGTILNSVQTAFNTFNASYASDLRTILYAHGGPNATTRAAFDTQVGNDLATLTTSVTAALSQGGLTTPLPSSLVSSLTTTLTSDLMTPASGATGASLQEHLAALHTPSSSNGSKLGFGIDSTWDIGNAEVQVYSVIISAARTYNQGLTTTTPPVDPISGMPPS